MKKNLGQDAIYDARELGVPRMLVLGLQHLFAMFGATVLVPILVTKYGLPLSIQTTLLFAGLGTLLFHLCTKLKVPAFLGSSFAYLGGFSTVASMPAYDGVDPNPVMAPFFILFFGMMMADMGYGLAMIVGSLLFLKKKRPANRSFMEMIFWCGIMTFIFGALTGVSATLVMKHMKHIKWGK